MRITLGTLFFSLIFPLMQPASALAGYCNIEDFNVPAPDQARLDRGTVGQWNDQLEQKLIQIEDLDGRRWDYYALQKKPLGHDAERLVLFLHGFPEFAAAWERELDYFGDQVNAVALDLKGHHYSSKPPQVDEYNFIEISWEIRAIVKCLGYDRVTIVGHDFGGAIAWTMGMFHPDILDGLVILNAPHPYLFGRELLNPDSDQVQRIQYMYYARGTTLNDQLNFNRILFSDFSLFNSDFYQGKRFLRLALENWLPASRWTTMKHYYRAMPIPATEQDYPRQLSEFQFKVYSIKAPTLVLWGMGDPYFSPQVLNGLDYLVKDLELVRYPGLSHWINHEAPDLQERIETFLQRTDE